MLSGYCVASGTIRLLVGALGDPRHNWQVAAATEDRCDAAALRLQSLYTGVEHCFVQMVRVLNGSPQDTRLAPTPAGADGDGIFEAWPRAISS
jgi:hypothetical protein